MQAWPAAPPPGQNYYELSSVFSANGLAPQVSYGASKPHVPRYNSSHRPNIRNKRNNHDHRTFVNPARSSSIELRAGFTNPHNSADPNPQQQQNQNVNPGHRSTHGSSGSIHQQPHHVTNQPPIPNQHNLIHNQSQPQQQQQVSALHSAERTNIVNQSIAFFSNQQQSLGATAVPLYKQTTAIISHGGNSAKSTDLYHYNANKISKENSFSISSNVPQIISNNQHHHHHQQQQHHHVHQQQQQPPQVLDLFFFISESQILNSCLLYNFH